MRMMLFLLLTGFGAAQTPVSTAQPPRVVRKSVQTTAAQTIEGQVLSENTTMLKMCKELGFAISHDPDDRAVCDARLSLS